MKQPKQQISPSNKYEKALQRIKNERIEYAFDSSEDEISFRSEESELEQLPLEDDEIVQLIHENVDSKLQFLSDQVAELSKKQTDSKPVLEVAEKALSLCENLKTRLEIVSEKLENEISRREQYEGNSLDLTQRIQELGQNSVDDQKRIQDLQHQLSTFQMDSNTEKAAWNDKFNRLEEQIERMRAKQTLQDPVVDNRPPPPPLKVALANVRESLANLSMSKENIRGESLSIHNPKLYT